jgi:hypothetical protein
MATIATFTGTGRQKKQKGKKDQPPAFPTTNLFAGIPSGPSTSVPTNLFAGAPAIPGTYTPATQTTTPRTPGIPGVTPGPWASGYVMPQQTFMAGASTPAAIYNAPTATAGGGSSTWQPAPGYPWASTNEVARWGQAATGYTNSAGTPIPGIPGLSFLDWYYQLGGRARPGMTQGQMNYFAAREAPYARLRARIARANVRRQEPGSNTPTAETVPGESLRYAPPTTNWRIG